MQIFYHITDSPLGFLLTAGTSSGICAVYIGDFKHQLKNALQAEYPAAEIRPDTARLGKWIATILLYLEGRERRLELPLDVRTTSFRQRVWDALRAIPYGHTRTYSEIALSLGHPNAARAVGSACAANPVSLLIPCHRALREDGSLGGYRWGLDRKRKLLEMERFPLP